MDSAVVFMLDSTTSCGIELDPLRLDCAWVLFMISPLSISSPSNSSPISSSDLSNSMAPFGPKGCCGIEDGHESKVGRVIFVVVGCGTLTLRCLLICPLLDGVGMSVVALKETGNSSPWAPERAYGS